MQEERIPNKELMRTARQQLKGKWSGPVGRAVLFLLFSITLVSMTSLVGVMSLKNFRWMWSGGFNTYNNSMCAEDLDEGKICGTGDHGKEKAYGKKERSQYGNKDGDRWGMMDKWWFRLDFEDNDDYGYYNLKKSIDFIFPAIFIGLPALKSILGHIFSLILMFGLMVYFLQFSRNNIDKTLLYAGFRPRLAFKTIITYVYRNILILLSTLLLIVPGIRAFYSYSMTPYILSDNPNLSISEILEKSRIMMQGNRMKLFLLHLRFFGWIILAMIPVGLGLLWVIPYTQLSVVNFYEDVKSQQSIPTV